MSSNTITINASSIPLSGRSGRWVPSPASEGLIASWCSASLEFLFSGTKLALSIGAATERKDKENGGTKMIAVITGTSRKDALVDTSGWKTFDPEPNSEVVVFHGGDGGTRVEKAFGRDYGGTKMIAVITGTSRKDALVDTSGWKTFDPEPNSEVVIFHGGEGGARVEKAFVRVVLIDWASRVEIVGMVVDKMGYIGPVQTLLNGEGPTRILAVGDSISSGLAVDVAKGGEHMPFGCLNTFPFVAQRVLRGTLSREVDVELIGYPGFSLVHPTEKEKEDGYPNGMQEAFFWESPWSKESSAIFSSPNAVLIELGTNDQFFKIPADRFGAALVTFVKALQKWSQNSILNVWLVPPFPDADSPPDYKEISNAMPGYVDTLTKEFGEGITFKVCDLVDGLTVEDTVDGVHPPIRVHNELGKKLAEFIEAHLSQIAV